MRWCSSVSRALTDRRSRPAWPCGTRSRARASEWSSGSSSATAAGGASTATVTAARPRASPSRPTTRSRRCPTTSSGAGARRGPEPTSPRAWRTGRSRSRTGAAPPSSTTWRPPGARGARYSGAGGGCCRTGPGSSTSRRPDPMPWRRRRLATTRPGRGPSSPCSTWRCATSSSRGCVRARSTSRCSPRRCAGWRSRSSRRARQGRPGTPGTPGTQATQGRPGRRGRGRGHGRGRGGGGSRRPAGHGLPRGTS